jgi:hypothetical protein
MCEYDIKYIDNVEAVEGITRCNVCEQSGTIIGIGFCEKPVEDWIYVCKGCMDYWKSQAAELHALHRMQ